MNRNLIYNKLIKFKYLVKINNTLINKFKWIVVTIINSIHKNNVILMLH